MRIVPSREETFITHRGRPETDIRLKIGMRKDGRITAVECECVQRGGAHSGYGVVTILYAGSMLYAIYDLHDVKYVGKRVLTNTPPAARSAATARSTSASRSRACSMNGEELGLDPLAVRRANLLTAPTFTDNDLMVNSYGLPECIDWVERKSGWKERKGKLPKGKGLGLRLLALHQRRLEARELDRRAARDGEDQARFRRHDRCAVPAPPRSARAQRPFLAQRVAEVLGLDLHACASSPATATWCRRTTAPIPRASPSWSATRRIDAAQQPQDVLIAAAARKLDASPDDIECLGELYRAGAQDKGADLRRGRERGAQGHRHHHRDRQLFDDPGIARRQEISRRRDRRHHGLQLFGAGGRGHGRRGHRRRHRRQGVGRARLRQGAEPADRRRPGAGLGLDGHGPGDERGGRLPRRPDASPPTCSTTACRPSRTSPPIEVGIVESNDPHGPFGAKEAGEGSLAAFLPALTNAIADAIGIRFNDLPVTPDRVFEAIEKRQRGPRGQTQRRRLMEALPEFRCSARHARRCLAARARHPGRRSRSAAAPISSSISAAASWRRRC